MKLNLIINVKMTTIVGILTFIIRIVTIADTIIMIRTIVDILTFMIRINLISECVKQEKKLFFSNITFYDQ